MLNKWIIQSSGERVVLGVRGSKDFINKSFNFIYNFEVSQGNNFQKGFGADNFYFSRTTFFKLERALKNEGRIKEKRRVMKKIMESLKGQELEEFLDSNSEANLSEYHEQIEESANNYYKSILQKVSFEKFYEKEWVVPPTRELHPERK